MIRFKSSYPDEIADLYNFSVSNVFDSLAPINANNEKNLGIIKVLNTDLKERQRNQARKKTI